MIRIITSDITPRKEYVFRLIFKDWLNIDYCITDKASDTENQGVINLIYGEKAEGNNLFFKAHSLLSEKTIRPTLPDYFMFNNIHALFPNNDSFSILPFDPFAAIFYMVSRYEEYISCKRDNHGRFEAEHSLAFKHGFHRIPVVDIWVNLIIQIIKNKYSEFEMPVIRYNYQPTYDIDQIWGYKNKGVLRTAGAIVKDLLKGKTKNIKHRLSVIKGREQDPFDTFNYILQKHTDCNIKPIFFIHPGTYGKYDKNIPLKNNNARKLLRKLSLKAEIGLHPSYRSVKKNNLLNKEINILQNALDKDVNICRQHYIKITFPETYEKYIANGITDDYSMGWATEIGFRAGTSRAFNFFNLKDNRKTTLTIHPFCIMDGALRNYLLYDTERSFYEISLIIDQIKKYGGTFISLWHNETLGTSEHCKGWNEIYEKIMQKSSL